MIEELVAFPRGKEFVVSARRPGVLRGGWDEVGLAVWFLSRLFSSVSRRGWEITVCLQGDEERLIWVEKRSAKSRVRERVSCLSRLIAEGAWDPESEQAPACGP